MAAIKKTGTKTAANTAAATATAAEKKTPVKAATTAKPAAKTAAAVKSAAAKKPTAKVTEKKAAAKTAEKKAATAKTAEKKAATAKTAEKKAAPAKTAEKKAPAKKAAPKKPAVTIDTICNKLQKKLPKTVSFKEKIAVDIEVWGFEDGSNAKMYIEANEGKVTVSPHTYDEKDFRVAVSFANAKAFVDGKMSLKDLLASPDFYAEGKIVPAIKLASIF